MLKRKSLNLGSLTGEAKKAVDHLRFDYRRNNYTALKGAERAKPMMLASEELRAMVLEGTLLDYDNVTWINGDPRDDHDLNEPGRPWSEVRPEFIALIEKTFSPEYLGRVAAHPVCSALLPSGEKVAREARRMRGLPDPE